MKKKYHCLYTTEPNPDGEGTITKEWKIHEHCQNCKFEFDFDMLDDWPKLNDKGICDRCGWHPGKPIDGWKRNEKTGKLERVVNHGARTG